VKKTQQEEAALLSRALHCLHDAVALVDLHRHIVFANPALEELLGVSRDALTGVALENILVTTETEDGKVPPLSLAGATSRSGQLLHQSKAPIPVRWRANLVSSPQTGVFSTFTFKDLRPEIRARKVEERLRHSERLTLLGQVFGGVAHEIRNPLGHIMLSVELLAQEQDQDEREALAAAIMSSAERCGRILEDALGVVRKDRGEVKVQSLFEPLREIVDLVRKPFSHYSIEVALRMEEEVAPLAFDRGKFQQVLINLLQNARDALLESQGGGRITVTLVPGEDGGAVLTVADNGPGIPKELLKRVGEAFFTTKPKGKGTGLGLSICHSLMEEVGGKLEMSNRPQGGALATLEFPLKSPPPKELAFRERPKVENRLAGKRILIIDDEEESLMALRRAMVALSVIQIDLARSAGEALAHLRVREYDLILCDIRLPGMSGLTLHQIAHVAFPKMAGRFLFLSGFSEDPRTISYFSDRPLTRLEKPCELSRLQVAMTQLLTKEEERFPLGYPAPFSGQARWF
jgi:signal transduction histidine kinase/ActR/RegA family two-component response regulator